MLASVLIWKRKASDLLKRLAFIEASALKLAVSSSNHRALLRDGDL